VLNVGAVLADEHDEECFSCPRNSSGSRFFWR
jgi:hypothetical protein